MDSKLTSKYGWSTSDIICNRTWNHNAPKYLINKLKVFENRCLIQAINFRRTPTDFRYIFPISCCMRSPKFLGFSCIRFPTTSCWALDGVRMELLSIWSGQFFTGLHDECSSQAASRRLTKGILFKALICNVSLFLNRSLFLCCLHMDVLPHPLVSLSILC